MAKKFATSLKVPYKGAVSSYAIKYCGGAKALPFYFPWRQYGTYLGSARNTAINPGVQFSTFVPPSQVLETVQGVFIDNTDCSSPVYLLCEDGHMVACADNATAYFPLMTNSPNFTLFIETIDGPYQADQQTNIFLLDRAVPPFLQGQSSNRFISLAQISGQEVFATPVIPDTIANKVNTWTGPTGDVYRQPMTLPYQTIITSPANTTLVITEIDILLVSVKLPAYSGPNQGYTQEFGFNFRIGGVPLDEITYRVSQIAADELGVLSIYQVSGLTLRLGAGKSIEMSLYVPGTGGGAGQYPVILKLNSQFSYASIVNPTS